MLQNSIIETNSVFTECRTYCHYTKNERKDFTRNVRSYILDFGFATIGDRWHEHFNLHNVEHYYYLCVKYQTLVRHYSHEFYFMFLISSNLTTQQFADNSMTFPLRRCLSLVVSIVPCSKMLSELQKSSQISNIFGIWEE